MTTAAAVASGAVASSVDLSQYAPPVGDQGAVNSCAAWSTIYGLHGWYARRAGYYPTGGAGNSGSVAPMYTYAQITKGQNVGTSFDANLNLAQAQGVDTRADYAQGDDDDTDQPTAGETNNATHYKIANWTNLLTGSGAQAAIENAMSSGNPVALGITVDSNFDNAGSSSYYVDVPTAGMTDYGRHGVFAITYDRNGMWIQNSWGAGWGLNGAAELSWAFIAQDLWQIVEVTPAAAPTSATSTPAPSNTVAPTTTPAPTNTPVPTKTPSPTTTAAPTTTPPTNTTVPVSNFTFSSGSPALFVGRGSTVRDTLHLMGLNGAVALRAAGLPAWTSAAFSVNPVSLAGQASSTTLSITPSYWASPGTYTLMVTASDGPYAHAVAVPLISY